MKNLKRALSLLLCLIMVAGLVPTTHAAGIKVDAIQGPKTGNSPMTTDNISLSSLHLEPSVYISSLTWSADGTDDFNADGTFKGGKVYTVVMEVALSNDNNNDGIDDTKGFILPTDPANIPDFKVSVNGTFETMTKSNVDGKLRYTYTFPATESATPTTYTVNFDSDGGSAVTAQTVESGKTATEPTAPTKEGYTFKGWTYKGSPYDFSKPVTENIILRARWGTVYNINTIPALTSGQMMSDDDLDAYFPSSSSYKYINNTPVWYWYDTTVPAGVALAGTNYYAYAIMYLEDYSAVPYEGDFVVKYADTVLSKINSTEIYQDNMKSGYRIYMFDTYNVALQVRIYLGTPNGAGTVYSIISGANGIYQKGSAADILSFTANGDAADFIGVEVDGSLINVSEYNVESGSTIVQLKKAYLESLSAGEHTLKIRYHDGEASTKFTVKDATPTTYTVTFDSDGGSAVTAQTVESGKTATKPADPTKTGYTFKGWTLDGADYDFATPVTGDITLKANWEAKQTATVIDEIHIGGVTMPVVGATPINSATTSTPGVTIGSDTFWVRYVPETNDLDDLYDDSTRVDDTPFRSGIKYALQVMLEPKDGFTIAPDAKIFYNGIQLPAPDTSDISKSCAMVHPDGTMAIALISGEASVPTTYTVTFDSDGGSAVTAQTVESGKTATKPADPTKEGYTFKGWTLDGAAYDFSSAVTKDITLEAAWEVIPTAIVIDEIHIGGVTMPVVGATPINSATTSTPGVTIGSDTFWVRYIPETNNLDDLYDDSTRVDDTPFRSGVKYSLQVMLETQNGCTIAADAKIFYNGIQLPAPDTSDISKSCATVHPDGTMAMALISGEASVPTTYTVTFDSDGGSAVTAQTVESGKTATKPADPTKEGYTFKGWTLDGVAYDFATPVTGAITLKAKWEAAAPIKYAIEVTLNGYSLGAKVADAYVSESSDTVDFYDFNADGTFFCIFEDDGTGQSDWGSTVTQFEADKDYWLVVALAKQGGDALPEADLDADNATLVNGCVDKITVYDDDLWWVEFKLSRLSSALPDVYTITFDAAGGSVTPGSATTGNDGKLTSLPTPTHTNPYAVFDGWYTGKTGDIKVTTDTVFTSDTTVYAHWNVDYAIEVTLNGYELGKKVADTTLTENSNNLDIDRENCHIFTDKAGEPDWSSTVTEFEAGKDYWLVIALTKQGGDALTDADLGADDVDLTNDYTKEQLVYDDDLWWVSYKLKRLDTSDPTTYTVTFDSDGGSTVAAQTVNAGGKATKPADPTKEGYTFKGWTLNGTAYDFNTAVTGNITLKATWEAKQATPPAGDNNQGTNKPADTPQTGDSMNLVLWSTLAMVSALTVVVLIVFKKKRYPVK